MNSGTYTTVTVSEARDRFAELVDRASLTGETFLVEKYGRPRVKITSLDMADKIDPMSLAGVWDNKTGDKIAKYAKQLRKTAKFIRG
jgi:prevent-host-death family protein